MHLKRRTTCRVCSNEHLSDVMNLGGQFLQGSFVKGDIKPPLRKTPLVLTLCDTSKNEDACGLLQLRHSVPPAILYKKYWYRSGTNGTMTEHLSDIAKKVNALDPKTVMDIGCNDGTFLKFLKPEIKRIGVDPSDAVKGISNGIEVINKCFPCHETRNIRADVITSFAMFYDLESPVEFVQEVKHCLAHDGVWIFEVAYLPSMLKNNAFDNVCHEHIEYYSLAVLDQIVADVGMHIVKAEINDVNCGSILCVAANKNSEIEVDREKLEAIREAEFDMCLDEQDVYKNFDTIVGKIRRDLYQFLEVEHKKGKKIHIYGASTKGNTLIQASGIAKFITCAAERNPEKWGARTLGTDISIVSEEESRAMEPDFYLVLPWHFRNEFLRRERLAWDPSRTTKRPKFIFPLPTFEVVEL